MAFPSYSTFPGYGLYPTEDYRPEAALAILPPETLEELQTGARRPSRRIEVTDAHGRVYTIPATEGDLTASWDATPHRETNLSLLDDEHGTYRALLDPRAKNRVRVYFGVEGPRTPKTEFPQGVFVATSQERDGRELEVGLADLSHLVRGRLMPKALQVAPPKTLHDAVRDVLDERAGWVHLIVPDGSPALKTRVIIGEPGADPWEKLEELAESFGHRVFFDAEGHLRVEPVTDPLVGRVLATWSTGEEGVLGSITSAIDGANAPDGVLVPWAGGVVIVPEDAGRLILYEGDATLLVDATQATSAGEAKLLLEKGATESVNVTVWPRFDVVPGDVVIVRDERSGDEFRTRITQVSWLLSLESMSVKLADLRRS